MHIVNFALIHTGKRRRRWFSAWWVTVVALLALILRFDANAAGGQPPASESLEASSHLENMEPGKGSGGVDDFLNVAFPVADGFDYPVGDRNGQGSYVDLKSGKTHNGWYIATQFLEEYGLGAHPGVDWNGRGGGNTDLGQPVWTVADGKVLFAGSCARMGGNVVIVHHMYYENHEKKEVYSVYAHLGEIYVQPGEIVQRRRKIGTVGQDPERRFFAHLHFELRFKDFGTPDYWPTAEGKSRDWIKRNYAEPDEFIRSHRKLFVPQKESTLILVDQDKYEMHVYKNGQHHGAYDISFGQSKGRKRRNGDKKTPKGMYFVINHHRGNFDGPYGKYYGGHWIKINYPNGYDAAWGRGNGLIDATMEKRIAHRWRQRLATIENTSLGGGIGFHGWIKEWDNDGARHLSWGCVVLHNYDIKRLFDNIPIGAMVIIR